MSRVKRIALAAVLLTLAGCASAGGNTDYQQYFRAVRMMFSNSFATSRVTLAQAAAIPYASLAYRVDGGPEQILVLATDTSGELLWTSAAHVVLATRGGRIVRSVGLAKDVTAITPLSGEALPPPSAAREQPFTTTRMEDFPDLSAYGARVNCRARPVRRETITILTKAATTLRVDESCQAPSLNWSFTDNYWIDPETGITLRSLQHLHPKGEKVETEILRPPG